MSYRALQHFLTDEFKSALKSTFKRSKNTFLFSEKNQFYLYFDISMVDLDNSYSATFYYGIGFYGLKNVLERIKGSTLRGLPSVFHVRQALLYDQQKYPLLEYDIKTKTDATLMAADVSEFVFQEVLPEFKNLCSVDALVEKINSNPEYIYQNGHLPSSVHYHLILDKLVRSGENYKFLKEKYLAMSAEWGDWDKNELKETIEFLDKFSQLELRKIADIPTGKEVNLKDEMLIVYQELISEIDSKLGSKNSYPQAQKINNILLNTGAEFDTKKTIKHLDSFLRQLYDQQIWNETINFKSNELYTLLKKYT